MAKYSILLVGRNKGMIGDFFTHLRDDLECLSCSGRFEDIRNHLKHYKPDALIYCLLEDSFEDMQQIVSAKSKLEEEDVPLVIIGVGEDCDEFSRYSANAAQLVIDKSGLSITQILGRLNRFLDGRPTSRKKSKLEEQVFGDQTLQEAARALDLELGISMPESMSMSDQVKKHILVVDDNTMMLKTIKESLRENYEVATAISGKVALKFLENKTVDLILLDYEMPVESGPQILEKLRANDATKDIPVIFLTGVKEESKIRKVLSMKPQGYLLKPIEHDKLIAAIKKQFGQE